MTVSILLSTLNEEKTEYLPKILSVLNQLPKNKFEIVAVDGGSKDATCSLLESAGITPIVAENSNRATRFNIGFNTSKGEMILFHHPRSTLPLIAFEELSRIEESLLWGGFTHEFDKEHPLLRWTSYYSNCIRFDNKGIVYLDHCIFAHRSFFLGREPYEDIDIFEDTELSERLREKKAPVRLPYKATTSAIRYMKNGVLRQTLMNQVLKLGYFAKLSPENMNKIYEKGLSLNNKY